MKNNTLKCIWVWAMLCSTWLLAETRSHEVKGDANATSKKLSKKQNIKKKSPLGYDEPNYLFIYGGAEEIEDRPWSNTIVLVKNYVPVSAALLYSRYSADENTSIPKFIKLDKTEYLKIVMDIINGKKCQEKEQESYKFDAAHFPIMIEGCSIEYDSKSKTCEYGEPGYGSLGNMLDGDEPTYCGDPYFYFTHYEKVDASYTKIDLKKEQLKELARNHKKWQAQHIKLYTLFEDNNHKCIKEIVKNGKHIKTVKRCHHRGNNRFLTVEDIFAFVKNKLLTEGCSVAAEYDLKYSYPKNMMGTCKGKKKRERLFAVTMEPIEPSDTNYLSFGAPSWGYTPSAATKVESSIDREDIIFSWVDNADDETGFKLYVNQKLLATVGRNINTFKIKKEKLKKFIKQTKGVDANTSAISLEVKAYNSAGTYSISESSIAFSIE